MTGEGINAPHPIEPGCRRRVGKVEQEDNTAALRDERAFRHERHRLYARLNVQEVTELSDRRAVFVMRDCRVQSARKRKGLPDFPCKSVGIVEYSEFARAVDPRIRTECIACPPDPGGFASRGELC